MQYSNTNVTYTLHESAGKPGSEKVKNLTFCRPETKGKKLAACLQLPACRFTQPPPSKQMEKREWKRKRKGKPRGSTIQEPQPKKKES